jgi:formamidopyrimidine-DNA glycosylase
MNWNLVGSIYGRSSKECTFCYDPLPNMVATGNSCFWLA